MIIYSTIKKTEKDHKYIGAKIEELNFYNEDFLNFFLYFKLNKGLKKTAVR